MSKYVRKIRDFSAGLEEVANDNMSENALMKAKNVVPGDTYGIARATGTEISDYGRVCEDGTPVVLLTELALLDDTTQIIAFTKVNAGEWAMYYYVKGGENGWQRVVESEEVNTMPPVKDWFVYAGCFYWLDGYNFRRWNGSQIQNLKESGSTTDWKIDLGDSSVAGFYNKVITSVAVEQRSTRWLFATKDNEVIFSEVGFPEKFKTINIINVTSGQADDITALHEFNEGMLIFQKRSIYYLQGYDFTGGSDIKLSKLNVSCGTEWPETVKTVENAVLFMGDNGLYRLSIPYYSTSIAAKNVSDKKISKRLADEKARGFAATVFNNIYYLTKMTDNGNYEYRYYTMQNSFWGEYTQNPYCYAPRLAGDEGLYIGCANGYILKYVDDVFHYINTDTGGISAIPIEVVTKGYDVAGNMVQNSKIKKVFVVLKQFEKESSAFNIQMKLDYKDYSYAYAYDADINSVEEVWNALVMETDADESMVWEEGKYSQGYWGWLDTVTKAFSVNSKCKRAQFTFRDNSLNNPLLLYGIAVLYKLKKVKGSSIGITEAEIAYND